METWGGLVVWRCHVSCHRGVQLILAYRWARPAILVAGKGREMMFLFLLFLHFHSCSSFFPVPLFNLFCYLFCRFFSLSLGDDTKWPTRVDVSLNPNTINPMKTICMKCPILSFGKNKKKYHQYSICWIRPESGKSWILITCLIVVLFFHEIFTNM